MKQISLSESFLGEDKRLSYFDLVHPLFKMNSLGVPESLLGSCFPIGVGFYVTAAHIFEPFEETRREYKPYFPRAEPLSLEEKTERMNDMRNRKDLFKNVDVNCGAVILDQSAIRVGRLKHRGRSLARYVVIFYDYDLAIIFLHEDERRNIDGERMPIACLPIIEEPKVGEKFTLVGFPGKNNRIKVEVRDGELVGEAWLGLVASSGEITAKHEVKRDEAKCFYPCLETTACMLSGHSGGPAISTDSLGVLGVNSTGFDAEDGSVIEYSVVSWMGKALDAEFALPYEMTLGKRKVKAGENISLRVMAECDVIKII
jgi:hypothetical protein